MTGGKGVMKTIIDDEVFRWQLQGAEEKFVRSIENLESANLAPGLNNTTFRIKLDADYFRQPDVLMGEDNEYLLEIVDGPFADATGTVYVCRLQGQNPAQYIPNTLFDAGKEFSKVTTAIQSEYNQIRGTQSYGSRFMLEGQVGAFGQELIITDKAWRKDGMLDFEFYGQNEMGEQVKYNAFLPMAEAKMHDELHKSIEVAMVYGKRDTSPAKDGYTKKTGSGIREQMKDSWQEYYSSPLTTNRLLDHFMNIFFTRKDENDRKVVGMTGTYGALMFHRMLAADAKSILTVDTNYINRINNDNGVPHLAYGAQFTRYRGPQGIVVDIMTNPFYDDRTYCKRSHPAYAGIPIDSFRMDFLDFGDFSGEGNIQMLTVKDTYINGYVAGTYTPSGPVTSGMMGSAKNGYSLLTEMTGGIIVQDVSRCSSLIYDSID